MTDPRLPSSAVTPPAWLKLAIFLKAVSILAFPVAVVAAAYLQRSVLLLGGFALVMVLIGAVQRHATAVALGQPTGVSIPRMVSGFALRFGAMIGVFIVLIGILALFRETTLARGLAQIDALLLIIPSAVSLGADLISRRIFGANVRATAESVQTAFNQATAGANGPSAPGDPDDIIIEGEVIDPDPPNS